MAGAYPDVPGRRMAYDRDGTIMARYDSSFTTFVAQLTAAAVARANSEDRSGVSGTSLGPSSNMGLAIIFSSLRTIRGYFIAHTSGFIGTPPSTSALETSGDTTNGIDGTWTNRGALGITVIQNLAPGATLLRTAITTAGPWTNIKAMRYARSTNSVATDQLDAWHVFGDDQATSRLAIWHPTLDQEHAGPYFDWGDVARGTVHDLPFRVKNLDPTRTANGIVVSREALTLTAPSQVVQHTLSDDAGASFHNSLNIGNLASGAISSVLIVRNSVDAAAQLSLAWLRLVAQATSFT